MMESSHPFYVHFAKIYGQRWPALWQALVKSERQVARVNRFSVEARAKFSKTVAEAKVGDELLQRLDSCFWTQVDTRPQRTAEDLLDLYIMDPASILAARALRARPGERILDMCAAPGGKSLVIAEDLLAQVTDADGCELRANDLSEDRRDRLKKVIQQYIPRDLRNSVWVAGKDAVQFGLREPGTFDRVLLDAPCSGERHILENSQAQKEWSPKRSEHLAARQYSLLSAAWLAIKPGGRIVYSTCSISPLENDDVIRKILKKKKAEIQLVPAEEDLSLAEKTEWGLQFLPDRCGFGPIYYAVLEKP
jgi:16S rRNA C967 or C1407 C5-methylase (RsmB/RsmF family)